MTDDRHHKRDALPLRRVKLPTCEELIPYLKRIDGSRWYSNFGPLLGEFEARLAVHFKCDPGQLAVVANATAALELALKASRPFRGRKCLMPSLTFLATPAAAVAAGLEPFFTDIDRTSWLMTPDHARAALAGGDIAAVMPVSAYGAPVDLEGWAKFRDETDVPVVVDAAWCFDSTISAAVTQCVSLHATKVFGVGEGGIILDRDPQRITLMQQMSNFGIMPDRSVEISGLNAKMSEYNAAVGLAALDSWPERRRQTLELQSWYRAALSGVNGLSRFSGCDPQWAGGTVAIVTELPLQGTLMAKFAEHGIEARYWWSRPCHEQPAYAACGRTTLAVTEWLRRRIINLPFFVGMSRHDVDRVVSVLDAVLTEARS